jgi:thioester reductase-like protein
MNAVLLPRLVVARHLGVDPDRIDPDRPLASYGMDSLRSMELVAALEDATGRSLPDTFCLDHPTLNCLAGALNGGAADRPFQDTRWTSDASLPSDFVVAIGRHPPADPRNVLLTGATGLLGAYLLRTLIDETDAQVWCLIRSSPGEGLARISTNLSRYGLWHDGLARRIEIVRGDLAQPNLGLTTAEYSSVASLTDAVMHAGADVDWVQPYPALRHVNVLGTLEVLRLAATARPKPVQFISSLSVCYVPDGPPVIDESIDCLPFVGRLPLGYAQTKCVAESLCRQASDRGLPMRVIRPALIAGDSRSGASNADDLIGRLVRGCIEMQAAPDLHWPLDAVPADEVARAIVGTPWPEPATFERVHLKHPRPRTWQECVLWINLLGYPCRLAPFVSWRSQLAHEVRGSSHPLSPLRTFFAATGAGDSPAELYQSTRHSAAASARRTSADGRGTAVRGMDATMLARHIDGYVAQGVLRSSGRAQSLKLTQRPIWEARDEIELRLSAHFGGRIVVKSIETLPSDASLGIISDLTSWRRGRPSGVFRHRLTIEGDGRPMTLAVVLKAKAHDEDALDAARALAAVCGDTLEREVRRFEDVIGLRGAGDREITLYEHADERLRRWMPVCYGTWPQKADRGSVLLLEDISDTAQMDATQPGDWNDEDIRVAMTGLASMHAAGLGADRMPCIGSMRAAGDVRRMAPLWQALAAHATAYFDDAGGRGLTSRHARLVDSLEQWAPALDAATPTLIHHDFNPRNVALRSTTGGRALCAYDWELVTTGRPQRDLVELLCFVLPADAEDDHVMGLIEQYRCLLTRTTERAWPEDDWREGFRAALSLLLIDRLAFYAMIQRVRPQSFLPRVLRTWQRLDAVVNAAAFARSSR